MVTVWKSSWRKSVRGDHVRPPSVVRHRPPVSAAAYMVTLLGLSGSRVGSTAMALIRPVAGGAPGAWPTAIGDGPMDVQVWPLSGIDADGTVRSSSRSRVFHRNSGRRESGARRRG